ncbi:MAG: hypothetical protein J0G33_08185 [Afipia felis]|nr:hypothetical protein [Afipia felis]
MFDALQGYRDKNGQPAVRALLENIAGVTAASEVPESKMQMVISACAHGTIYARLPSKKSSPSSIEDVATRAWARWNNPPPQG